MGQRTAAVMIGLFLCLGAKAVHAAEAAPGKALYDKSCAGCHGGDGKGNEKMTTILGVKDLSIVTKETAKKSDEQWAKVIAEGAGKMPASKLTKDEQKQVLSYSRSLAK